MSGSDRFWGVHRCSPPGWCRARRHGVLGHAGIVKAAAVGHDQDIRANLLEAGHRLGEGAAIRPRAARGINGDDLRTSGGNGDGVIQGRGDEDAVVTVLPQADHGDLDVLIDQARSARPWARMPTAPPATQAWAT